MKLISVGHRRQLDVDCILAVVPWDSRIRRGYQAKKRLGLVEDLVAWRDRPRAVIITGDGKWIRIRVTPETVGKRINQTEE